MLQHDMEGYRSRWTGFGWHALIVDGHDLSAIISAFHEAARTKNIPTVLLAKTFKGKAQKINQQLKARGREFRTGFMLHYP